MSGLMTWEQLVSNPDLFLYLCFNTNAKPGVWIFSTFLDLEEQAGKVVETNSKMRIGG